MMQRERRDERVAARHVDAHERSFPQHRAGAEPRLGGAQHPLVQIDADQLRVRAPLETSLGERARSDAEIDDRSLIAAECRGPGVEHRVVIRDERPDARIVLSQIDPEVLRNVVSVDRTSPIPFHICAIPRHGLPSRVIGRIDVGSRP
jgi:hypothetical protein